MTRPIRLPRYPLPPIGSSIQSPSDWSHGPADDSRGHERLCRTCGERGCRCPKDDHQDDNTPPRGPLNFER